MNSAAYKAFDEEQLTFTNYVNSEPNAGRFMLTYEQSLALALFYQEWTVLYYDYVNPAKHTRTLVAEMREAYTRGRRLINSLREYIRKNPAVELTADDRVILKIPARHPLRQNIPAAEIPPKHEVFKTVPGSVTFNTVNTINPHTTRRGLPKDQYGLMVMTTVLDEDRPPTDADFHSHIIVTRMRFTVNFEPDDRHKIGYMKSAWLTQRRLRSPDSEPLQFHII